MVLVSGISQNYAIEMLEGLSIEHSLYSQKANTLLQKVEWAFY